MRENEFIEKKVLGRNLDYYLRCEGRSRKDLSDAVGVSRSAVDDWCVGNKLPRCSKLPEVADYLNITPNELLNSGPREPGNVKSPPRLEPLPLISMLQPGTPVLAEQNVRQYVDCPEQVQADFAVRCEDDSMINARIFPGDIIYAQKTQVVESNSVMVVILEGRAQLRRIRLMDNVLVLEPSNPMHEAAVYRGNEMNQVQIVGKAVAFTSTIK